MGKTILISLVSDQTRPNIQLINEFKSTTDMFLFLSTKGMENKGCRRWIENAAHITEDAVNFVEIHEFSFDNILSTLEGYGFSDTDTFIVNLTGGTKVMSIAAYEFFRHKNSKLIYITGGSDGKYIEIDGKTGERKEKNLSIKEEKLEDYLSGYGFSFSSHNKLSGHGLTQAANIFDLYCNSSEYAFHEEAIKAIHLKRGKAMSGDDYRQVENYLRAIKFSPVKSGELSKNDTKYLSGDWFEEFIGISIRNELHLSNDQLYIGTQLCKESPIHNINDFDVLKIQHPAPSSKQNENEIDVMFLYNGRFYTIECKSSILSKEGDRTRSILSETIYKADSLRSRFGLFANTSIVTLTSFEEEYEARKQNIINDVNRANLSNIRLVDRNMLLENRNRISEIFVKQ